MLIGFGLKLVDPLIKNQDPRSQDPNKEEKTRRK